MEVPVGSRTTDNSPEQQRASLADPAPLRVSKEDTVGPWSRRQSRSTPGMPQAYPYPGQTERLAELDGAAQSSMLFTAVSPSTGWRLNTLLATTHIPCNRYRRSPHTGTGDHKLNVLLDFCQRFNPSPELVVAGLNPHAGEQGHSAQRKTQWLTPLLHRWRLRPTLHVRLRAPSRLIPVG